MMSAQAALFLAAAACGAALALVFDLFRAVRITLKPNRIVTALTDIIYVFLAFSSAVYCVWRFGNGKFRYYEILGLVLGAVIYSGLLSRFILKALLVIVNKFCLIIRFILKILLTPLLFLYKILIVPARKAMSLIMQRRKKGNVGKKNKPDNEICKDP